MLYTYDIMYIVTKKNIITIGEIIMTINKKQLEEMKNAHPDSLMGMAHNLLGLIKKHEQITGTKILVENPTPEPEPSYDFCCYEHASKGGSCDD